MGWFKWHEHKFNYRTNLLWCECGQTKELPCLHDWKIHSEEDVINRLAGGSQNQQILKCITCGELKSVNTTSGVIQESQ